MQPDNALLQPSVHDYCRELCSAHASLSEVDVCLRQLHEATLSATPFPEWCSTPEQVQCLQWLIRLMSARRAIEIGAYTGYASLAMAHALGPGGELFVCDKTDEWVATGLPYWQQAGVRDRIQLTIAPAIDSLTQFIKTGMSESMDFIFIDADKIHYHEYYELSMSLLRPGGVMVIDNALFLGGQFVADQAVPATRSVYALNADVVQDLRVEICCMPIGAGMLAVRKQ